MSLRCMGTGLSFILALCLVVSGSEPGTGGVRAGQAALAEFLPGIPAGPGNKGFSPGLRLIARYSREAAGAASNFPCEPNEPLNESL
jgi:hypothetical protein